VGASAPNSGDIEFDTEGFLADFDDKSGFMQRLVATQMFQLFVARRADTHHDFYDVLLFEQLLAAKANRSRLQRVKRETEFLDYLGGELAAVYTVPFRYARLAPPPIATAPSPIGLTSRFGVRAARELIRLAAFPHPAVRSTAVPLATGMQDEVVLLAHATPALGNVPGLTFAVTAPAAKLRRRSSAPPGSSQAAQDDQSLSYLAALCPNIASRQAVAAIRAVCALQARFRARSDRSRFLALRRAAVAVQARARAIHAQKLLREKIHAAHVLGRAGRVCAARLRMRRTVQSAVAIQSVYRAYSARQLRGKRLAAVLLIQRVFRGADARTRVLRPLLSATWLTARHQAASSWSTNNAALIYRSKFLDIYRHPSIESLSAYRGQLTDAPVCPRAAEELVAERAKMYRMLKKRSSDDAKHIAELYQALGVPFSSKQRKHTLLYARIFSGTEEQRGPVGSRSRDAALGLSAAIVLWIYGETDWTPVESALALLTHCRD
jgi:hypothetical protein